MNCLRHPSPRYFTTRNFRLESPFERSTFINSYGRTSLDSGRSTQGSGLRAGGTTSTERLRGCPWNTGRRRNPACFLGLSQSTMDGHKDRSSTSEKMYLALDDIPVAGKTEVTPGLFFLQQSLLHRLADHLLLQGLVGEQTGSPHLGNAQRR